MGVTVILLTTGSPLAWSHSSPGSNFHNWKHSWSRAKSYSGWFHKIGWPVKKNTHFTIGKNPPRSSGATYSVPEIDAASGTSALALLTGVLLLAGERSRSRRR
jgi:hypothetical protein